MEFLSGARDGTDLRFGRANGRFPYLDLVVEKRMGTKLHSKRPQQLATLAAGLALAIASVSILIPNLYSPHTPVTNLPGAMSQDVGTLICSGLILFAQRWAKQDPRWWTVWLGALGYIAYGYALYAFEELYNPVYLGYVAVFGLSVWSVAAFFATTRLEVHGDALPRRSIAALLATFVVVFACLWLSIILPAMASRVVPNASTIFVLDLALVLPALGVTAALLFQAKPLGDVLAVPLLLKASSLGLSVLLGTLLGPMFGLSIAWQEVCLYAFLGGLPIPFLIRYFRLMSVTVLAP